MTTYGSFAHFSIWKSVWVCTFCTAPWDPGIARNHMNMQSILQFRVSTKSGNQSYPYARFRVSEFCRNAKTRVRVRSISTFRGNTELQYGLHMHMVSCNSRVPWRGAKV